MKKSFSPRSLALSIIAISLLAIIIIITTTSSKASSPLGTRLSGKILLQVEDSGKAWYVSADNDNQRIYLGSPEEAHCLMKTLGLGISNNDLNRYLNTNNNKFPARLSGKILLAVEKNGEAYYINPDNLKGYYLGRPIDALKLMRELSLGITNTNLNTIPVLDNTEMLKKCNITKTEEQKNTETNISLVTQEVAPMTNFSHIVSVSATITNPDNISIKERGLLYDFTIFPNTNLTPTLDKYNQKLISETSSPNNTYTINISNLIPGSYPFIRSYAITGDNQIIYGNTINITGLGSNSLPSSLISSPLPVYTLTYTAGANGTLLGSATQNISKNSNGTAVEAVPNTGYHFVNWSDDLTDNPRIDTSITSNLSVTANFAINTYTVTFEDHDGSFISSSSVNYGSGATAPAPPTIVGYTFTGWNVAFNNVTSDLTVTAQYTINSYTLTYTAGTGGSLTGLTTQSVNYDSDGTDVTAVPNTGYHFVNWSDGSTANPRTDTNITSDLSVIANFAINIYTVTFKDYDNSVISSSSVIYGNSATAPADPTRTGYTFNDWDVAFDNITSDLTVTAQYTINSYTLTYIAGAGGSLTGSTTQSVNYNSDGTEVTAVADSGYHFVKWSDDLTDNPRTDINISGNITVEAEFAELVCPESTITDARDGKIYETVAIGSQCWFKENLAYLPMVHNNSDYVASSTAGLPGYGVYGYYGSDLATAKSQPNYSTYGVLYNWYAVDQVNICPTGWHVPTDAEWTALTNHLGTNAGSKLAGSYDLWNNGALRQSTDFGTSGFNALPAGDRNGNGDFNSLGGDACFWSSSEDNPGNSWSRYLGSGIAGVNRYDVLQANGYSVRCLRTE